MIAEELRTQSAQVARIDGAITGTPFLIALVPGYLGYLWQEGRMVLRTAALYGRDPRELDTSADGVGIARRASDSRRGPRGPARGARPPAAGEASDAAPAADLGPQHLRAADLRRVPLSPV